MSHKFNIGDKVRIKGYREHASIRDFCDDVKGGVILDHPIGDFRYWNVADLIPVEKNPHAVALGRKGGTAKVPKGFASPEVLKKALETRRKNKKPAS